MVIELRVRVHRMLNQGNSVERIVLVSTEKNNGTSLEGKTRKDEELWISLKEIF